MATLKSNLVVSLIDRASGPARGIMGLMGRLRSAAPVGGGLERQAGGMMALTRSVVALGAGYLGVREGMRGTVGGAMALETAMADVAKKTTLSETGLARMRKRILEISTTTPLAATEIATLVAQAGQFGIANEDLERFALLGAKAAIAFDMGTEQTADSLSQLKNAFGLTMDQLGQLADAINFSADTAGASEEQVIDFLLRTAAAGKTFGVLPTELAAFGATLNEIGIDSAKAGTGMNAMMAKLAGLTKNRRAVKFLDQVGGKGYSAKLQKKFFETPVEAMKEFFGVVGKLDAQKRSGFLIDFFGLEYQDDAAAIANNIETINRRLVQLGDVSSYSGSVQKTFDIFAATTEQKLKLLRNNIEKIGNGIGAAILPGIVAFTDRLTETLGTLDSRVTIFDTIKAKIEGFLTGLGLDMSGGASVALDKLWTAIFGNIKDFEHDVDQMGASFEDFRKMGAIVRDFAGDIGALAQKVSDFLGVDIATVVSTLGSIGGVGFKLTLGAIGISMAASALLKLGRAVMFLSGASLMIGGAKGIGRLFGAIAGGGAAAAAAGGGAAKGAAAAVPAVAAGARGGGVAGPLLAAGALAGVMYLLKDWKGGVWDLWPERTRRQKMDAASRTKDDQPAPPRKASFTEFMLLQRSLDATGRTKDDKVADLGDIARQKSLDDFLGDAPAKNGDGSWLRRFLFGAAAEPGFDFRDHMRIEGVDGLGGGEGGDRLRDGRFASSAELRALIDGLRMRLPENKVPFASAEELRRIIPTLGPLPDNRQRFSSTEELRAIIERLGPRLPENMAPGPETPRQVSLLGTPPVSIAGPVTTQPSGVQDVRVTNPPPAPVINVTVNAVTNAAPAAIGQAVGDAVAKRLRGAFTDGGQ